MFLYVLNSVRQNNIYKFKRKYKFNRYLQYLVVYIIKYFLNFCHDMHSYMRGQNMSMRHCDYLYVANAYVAHAAASFCTIKELFHVYSMFQPHESA